MTWWQDDADAFLGGYSQKVVHPDGTDEVGILDVEDVMRDSNIGMVQVRETVLLLKTAAWPNLARGDTLTYGDDTTTTYLVERIDREDDTFLRVVVSVPA